MSNVKRITLPLPEGTAPKTNLFVKIIKKNAADTELQWDRKVMLLIPGGPGGDHTLYEEIETELLEHADLVIVDLRGCGLSDPSDVKYCSLQQDILDIEALRIALKIEMPIIFGCSYGAFVGLGYAINYPNNLSKLILISGAASYEFIEKAKKNLAECGSKEQIEMAELLWHGKFASPEQVEEYSKIMAPLYLFNQPPQDPSPSIAPNDKIPYHVELINQAFTSSLKTFDYRKSLREVKASTLIMSGKNDWIIDSSEAIILNKGISGSHLATFEQCGHLPWKDQKQDFFSKLDVFLATN